MKGKQIENPSVQKIAQPTWRGLFVLNGYYYRLSHANNSKSFVNSAILNNFLSLAVCRFIQNEWVEMMSKELIGLNTNVVGDCSLFSIFNVSHEK